MYDVLDKVNSNTVCILVNNGCEITNLPEKTGVSTTRIISLKFKISVDWNTTEYLPNT
jgi:hypothetical protein